MLSDHDADPLLNSGRAQPSPNNQCPDTTFGKSLSDALRAAPPGSELLSEFRRRKRMYGTLSATIAIDANAPAAYQRSRARIDVWKMATSNRPTRRLKIIWRLCVRSRATDRTITMQLRRQPRKNSRQSAIAIR